MHSVVGSCSSMLAQTSGRLGICSPASLQGQGIGLQLLNIAMGKQTELPANCQQHTANTHTTCLSRSLYASHVNTTHTHTHTQAPSHEFCMNTWPRSMLTAPARTQPLKNNGNIIFLLIILQHCCCAALSCEAFSKYSVVFCGVVFLLQHSIFDDSV